ncbi:hypothetical protein HJC99_01475 [Candidatus Saccharibacteria bacterium]|nr:hypothetical protein [Candidatus Saccharibacteria bacterium]
MHVVALLVLVILLVIGVTIVVFLCFNARYRIGYVGMPQVTMVAVVVAGKTDITPLAP